VREDWEEEGKLSGEKVIAKKSSDQGCTSVANKTEENQHTLGGGDS